MNKELAEKRLAELRPKLGERSRLLVVSKTRPIQDIQTYYDLGQRDFGENRVQELAEKARELNDRCPEIRWHMIGHLQTNKVNALMSIPKLHAIHSVHSLELLDKIMKHDQNLDHAVKIFLQFNASHEEEKSGFETYTELQMAAENALKGQKIGLAGLMTMGTLRTENFEAEAGRCFQDLNVEKEKLQAEYKITLETSMGMSQDYEIALKEGSNWIRLGTMLFV
jgi:pyridoxal phosphate enzyme (YggS family)